MRNIGEISWPGWEVVRKIGNGSFGTVYEIQRDIYGDIEKAALKVITIPHNEDEVDYLRCTGLDNANITQTFYRQVGDIAKEYKLMAQMRENPNVVRCDDFRDIQHDDGLGWDIYIKMELLVPLMKCLDKVATEEQVVQLGKDICNALVSCQEKNIIHRDIKPQNVFVSEKGRFKLGDFGIARTIERTTRATAGIGTYSYMAPEVEKNESYGKSADIYSLGLMMYWLLNKRRGPFMPLPPIIPQYGDEEKARQRRFSGEALPAPANGGAELKAIVLKACAYDVKDRYSSAHEMLEALNALGGAAPVVLPIVDSAQSDPDPVGETDGTVTVGPVWMDKAEAQNDLTEEGTQGPVFAPRGEKASTSATDSKTKYQIRFLDNDGKQLNGNTTYAHGDQVYPPLVKSKEIDGVKCNFLRWEPSVPLFVRKSENYVAVYEKPTEVVAATKKRKHGMTAGAIAVVLALLLMVGGVYMNRSKHFHQNEASVSNIYVSSMPRTDYYVGQSLDTSEMKLTVVYSDGFTETLTSGFSCSPTFFPVSTGAQVVTVSYGGKTTSFAVVVRSK